MEKVPKPSNSDYLSPFINSVIRVKLSFITRYAHKPASVIYDKAE
jgi:hypothetical protein